MDRLGPLLFAVWFLLARPAGAVENSPPPVSEQQVKAVFLYHFLSFVSWPPSAIGPPDDPYRICVSGSEAFRRLVERVVQGERVKGRPVRVDPADAPAGFPACHIVFFGAEEASEAVWDPTPAGGRPILTVSDAAGFAARGGMVELVRKGDRIHLNINIDAVRAAGLQVSSKLLRIATVVDPAGR